MGRSVNVVDYDPRWSEVFEELRATISAALGDMAIRVEHVGSTAVAGLAAKPIIDIDAVVPDDGVREAIRRLSLAGYSHEGDLGIAGREAFASPRDLPVHHLYVCPVRSPELERHVRFRDLLRADAGARAEYSALKRRLATEAADGEAYTAGKSALIERVLGQEDA